MKNWLEIQFGKHVLQGFTDATGPRIIFRRNYFAGDYIWIAKYPWFSIRVYNLFGWRP